MDNGHEPATKQDVQDAVENLEHRMDRRFDDLTELVRDTETKLLQAFYGYAKSNDTRVLEVEANEAVLRSRVSTIESRLTEVEKRLNIPPTQ